MYDLTVSHGGLKILYCCFLFCCLFTYRSLDGPEKGELPMNGVILICSGPVSYTHLDVYKRQEMDC